VYGKALNKRLNTTNYTLWQISEELGKRNMTFPEAHAIVEQDSWWYGDHRSMVCSSFLINAWRAGGLFEDVDIQAVEFSPKDAYQLTYLNTSAIFPQSCKYLNPTG